MNPASSVLGVGRDLGRAFRERPALIVGGGVLALIGVSLLNRGATVEGAAGEAPATDPAAGLFPGVGSYGGEVPGSGSVPFPGYPSAGEGGSFAPTPTIPGSGFDFPITLPSWGLTCNGEPKPSISGLPGSWECTDDGWKYVAPATSSLPSLPAPSPTPTPTPIAPSPTPTPIAPAPSPIQWWPSYLGAPPAAAQGYVVVNGSFFWYLVSGGRITGRSATSAQFSAYVGSIASYPWSGRGSYSLGRILSGTHSGRWIAVYDAPVVRLVKR